MIPRLCYVTAGKRGTGGRPLADVIECAAAGGVEMVVLREPGETDTWLGAVVERLLPCRRAGLRVLISRRIDLARAWGLDGVQLARDAIPVREARNWLGPRALIGYSAHCAAEARRVAEEGASYVMLSPIYPTDSKPGAPGKGPGWLHQATRGLSVPVLALGGITPERVRAVRRAGAWGVAVVSALGAANDIERAARRFVSTLGETTEE